MPAGEFKGTERFQVEEAIRQAEQVSRFEFSVFVGRSGADPRAFATQLHNKLVAPARSVLILVDPAARVLEIVTGGEVRRNITDTEVELTVLQMQSSFADAAQTATCRGFAVGRSIFSAAANGWLRGVMNDEAAIADMASRYRRLIEFWMTHRNAGRSGRNQAAG